MKIRDIRARGFDCPIPVKLVGLDRTLSMSVCTVDVETDEGITGHGFTSKAVRVLNNECSMSSMVSP